MILRFGLLNYGKTLKIQWTNFAFSRVQFGGVHIVVQLSPLSVVRSFSSSPVETLYLKNNVDQGPER